jgi:hypothetical protein
VEIFLSSDIDKLLNEGYPTTHPAHKNEVIEAIHADYIAIRKAIVDLATGKTVARISISGKSTDFAQADLPQLRTLRDELATELRALMNISQAKAFKLKTSSGF